MTDCFVKIPEEVLKKLIFSGDTLVCYSSFGKINLNKIKQILKINNYNISELKIRSNNNLVERTMMGQNFGTKYHDYIDSDAYGMCRDYTDIPLKIIKLPFDLLNDELIKFQSETDKQTEELYFNIYKVQFNTDGTFILL